MAAETPSGKSGEYSSGCGCAYSVTVAHLSALVDAAVHVITERGPGIVPSVTSAPLMALASLGGGGGGGEISPVGLRLRDWELDVIVLRL